MPAREAPDCNTAHASSCSRRRRTVERTVSDAAVLHAKCTSKRKQGSDMIHLQTDHRPDARMDCATSGQLRLYLRRVQLHTVRRAYGAT